jgi:hypothetical protein
MKKIVFLFTYILSLNSQAQDTIKVLFIGNSFTSQNDLPALFSQLSQSSGENVIVASHMPGGISVGDVSQGISAHMNNPLVYSLIRSNNWDYLVLQDNQGRFCLGYGQFPSSSLVIEGHLKIRDSLLYYHPCAHMIWYAGFGPKDGYPPYASTGSALIDTIYQNYQFLRDTAGQIIAPIGPAFQRIIHNYPTINLWDTDDVHPSLNGSFLIANVLYTTIFKKSPIHCTYNPDLNADVDSVLKNTGFQTTLDSINNTGLREITPEIVQSGNNLTINGYSGCTWFYNNNPISSISCNVAITQSGSYYALANDGDGCNFRTIEQNYYCLGFTENQNDKLSNISISPNPAVNQMSVTINNPFSTNVKVEFYGIKGELIWCTELTEHQNQMDISSLSDGLYFVLFKTDNGNKVQKLIIQKD